jgi:acetolactate synthase-1/2/3 large subunit
MSKSSARNGRTGGQILVDCLIRQGVDLAFCVPGESYLAALDALHDVTDKLRLIVCRQEGGAAIMAEAHGKLTGRPGVCFVTRGPGATNASTGVHTAFQDSTPMVLFIGQVARDVRHREGFQEVDLAAMFAPLAKWAAEVSDPARLPEYIHRAFQTAMAGRPGPVVLVLPEDMLTEVADGDIEYGLRAEPVRPGIQPAQVDGIMAVLDRAQRPLMIVGGGGWTAQAGRDAMAFAEKHDIPVAVSLRCQDYVDNRHPNYVGHFTIGADPTLAARLKEADTVIVLGSRLGEMTTGGYTLLVPPRVGKTLVHVHADAEELGRVYQADLSINASQAVALEALAARPGKNPRVWHDWMRAARLDYEKSLEPAAAPPLGANLAEIVVALRKRLPPDTIVTNGAGNYTGWLHKHWIFNSYRTQLAPTSGAMGYGVPAGIAASLALPGRTVLAVAGDGCFQMHPQELATAAQYGAKVLYLIVNNGVYGTIRMHQEREYPGRVMGTDIVNPDFVTLARSYGLQATRVLKTADFADALETALQSPSGALIEVVTEAETISVRSSITKLRETALARLAAG